jgi:hypothetical protein
MTSKVFSLYKMDALGHCLMMHTAKKSGTAVVLPINTKKIVDFFHFFQKWRIFSKKCNKSQNIPNMKTKIFSYPSIVLATYGKPNSEIRRFSHFWPLMP